MVGHEAPLINVGAPNVIMVPAAFLELATVASPPTPLAAALAVAALSTGWGRGGLRATTAAVSKLLGLEESAARRQLKRAAKAGALERVGDQLTGERWMVRVAPAVAQAPLEGYQAPPPPPERERVTKAQRELRARLAAQLWETLGQDPKVASRPTAIKVRSAAKMLELAGMEETHVVRARVTWGRDDWRGKRGQAPTVDQLVDLMGQMAADSVEAQAAVLEAEPELKAEWSRLHRDWLAAGGLTSGQPRPPALAPWLKARNA